jgi:hypothetical protein
VARGQADDAGEVGPASAPPGGAADAEDRAAALLGRWQAHHEDAPAASGDAGSPDVATPVAPRHAAPRPPTTGRATDAVTAGREIMDALARADEPARDAAPAPRTPRHAATPAPTTAEPAPAAGPEVGPSLNVDFEPRLGARQVVGTLLLVSAAATAAAAYLAYDDARPLTLGAAGTLLVLTLLLYAVRAGSAVTYLAIRSGQLEVRRAKELERFDLTSRFTRIEVVGKPGRPGWKVLLGRFGREPLVITGSDVDPHRFTAELERYRPRA